MIALCVYGALAAVAGGQPCAWDLLRRYDFARDGRWAPAVLLAFAFIGVAAGFVPFVYRPSLNHSAID